FGVVGRRRLGIGDPHVGGEERVAVRVRKQEDRFGDVADVAFGERRLIVVDQRDDVSAGDVGGVDDREAWRFEIELDAGDAAGGNRRSDRAAVEESGEGEVVDV